MTEPVRPRPSATVLLARDSADGIELFMVVRHHQIDFASGALVFPGGSLDPGDRDPRLRTLADGVDDIDDNVLAVRVAAAREAFEECGVLYARAEGSDSIVDGQRAAALGEKYRSKLEANAIGLADIAEAEGLRLCLDQLHHFAHWITPVHMPKRFDTHFFLARAPADHHLVHDGSEAVDSVWIKPDQALKDADAGKQTLVFATRLNIERAGRSRTVAEAIERTTSDPIIPVLPDVEKTDKGRILRIPIEAGYGRSEYRMEGGPGSSKQAMKET
ncbi:MAG: NUDIX hydrolase [Hyphomicrobiaceae bacterium]